MRVYGVFRRLFFLGRMRLSSFHASVHTRRIFFVKILENNNKSNSLEENLILVETIPIKEYTYNRFVVSFGGKLWII